MMSEGMQESEQYRLYDACSKIEAQSLWSDEMSFKH